jgi:hypothetical protein
MPEMITIPFPAPDFTIREENGRTLIRDKIRRKMIVLTPEEWVRQNFLNYLTVTRQYPRGWIGVEKEIQLGSLKKRCDIIVYKHNRPWMIVECKEMEINIQSSTLEQILRYNMALPVEFLVLTNGRQTYCIRRSDTDWHFTDALPDY